MSAIRDIKVIRKNKKSYDLIHWNLLNKSTFLISITPLNDIETRLITELVHIDKN